MFVGYMTFSGIEVVNHARLQAGMTNGLVYGFTMPTYCSCDTLAETTGPFTVPSADAAPWYDATRPESAHFGGVFLSKVVGLDDPYTARTVEAGLLGGVLGGLYLGPRVVTFEAALFGASVLSMDYGLQWLTSVLDGKACGAETFCNLGDLGFYATCPDNTRGAECGPLVPVVDETTLDLARTGFSGGLVSGPRVVDRLERNGTTVGLLVTWSIALEAPWFAGGSTQLVSSDLDAGINVGTETYECPGWIDPCPPPTAAELAANQGFTCASYVEQTCDWNDGYQPGPPSWTTQAWTPTGEEQPGTEQSDCPMTLTRTGNAAIDGCQRPSVRMLFAGAAGTSGPLSIQFTLTEGQGNLYVHLWNPATDTNIPISSVTKPTNSPSVKVAAPTGDAYNILNSPGTHTINYSLPSGVDPGTLYFILSAFGGNLGGLGGTPVDETVSNIKMRFTGGSLGGACCTLEPGDPIYDPTYEIPCYTIPGSSLRTYAQAANPDPTTEAGLRFVFQNPSGTELANMRVGIYDPTRIGLAATTSPAGWPTGVEEWECNALVGEFLVPSVPAGYTLDVDGRRRQVSIYPVGLPEQAASGDRYFYGGGSTPWLFDTIPTCTTYQVVVFADNGSTPAGATVTVLQAGLYLMDGAAA